MASVARYRHGVRDRPEVGHPVAQMPPADPNPDLQSAFSFLILIARFVILEACSFLLHRLSRPRALGQGQASSVADVLETMAARTRESQSDLEAEIRPSPRT